MIWLLYDFLLVVAGLVMAPHLILKMRRRGGYRENFGNRLGRFSHSQRDAFGDGGAILIHAASVGEVGVAFQFIEALRRDDPSLRFVVSVTSSTGWKEAERRLSPPDALVYCPIDLPFAVARALDAIRPSAFVMVETEIWPNLLRACHARSIPMAIVNGRISDKSAPSYRRLRFLFGPALRLVRLILAQSALDAGRFEAAGANPASIKVTGSFKFDVARRNEAKEAAWKPLLAQLGLLPPTLLLVGASTWEGEEALLMDCYLRLRQRHPALRLALVPRHFERRLAVETAAAARSLRAVRKSDLDAAASPDGQTVFGQDEILLVDTTGEMMGLYPFATIAVVGRSFRSRGGQNMIEPCLCGVPTIVGPETQNFRPVMADLLASKALIQVPDDAALEKAIDALLGDAAEREALGRRASEAVLARRGAVGVCAAAFREACLGRR